MPRIRSLISLVETAERSASLVNLVGHDGEAEALVAGLRRFDRRVQGKEVRLLGNVVDDLDDAADVLDLRPQGAYGLRHAPDGLVDLLHAGGGFVRRDLSLPTASRDFWEISTSRLTLSATRLMDTIICSMEDDVSFTDAAWDWVFFATPDVLAAISCMVAVISSMAAAAFSLFFDASSAMDASWELAPPISWEFWRTRATIS